jgi:hypothetical protein
VRLYIKWKSFIYSKGLPCFKCPAGCGDGFWSTASPSLPGRESFVSGSYCLSLPIVLTLCSHRRAIMMIMMKARSTTTSVSATTTTTTTVTGLVQCTWWNDCIFMYILLHTFISEKTWNCDQLIVALITQLADFYRHNQYTLPNTQTRDILIQKLSLTSLLTNSIITLGCWQSLSPEMFPVSNMTSCLAG